MKLVVLFSLFYSVIAHGKMRDPPARNVISNNDCPDCLNAGGTTVVYKSLHSKAKYGVCGDPWNKPKDHEVGGKYYSGRIVKTYKSGNIITIKLSFTANHQGRMSFGICDLPDDVSKSKEHSLTTQRCFDRNVLRRVDGKGVYSYLKGTEEHVTVKYRLPKGLKCKHCIIQWRWITGNSCCPSGTRREYCGPGVDTCFRYTVPEEWFNCADIRIV
jgi:hypothetical protein